MFMLFPEARERTEAEYRRLLSDAGLDLARVVPTSSPAGLSVLESLPAQSGGTAATEDEERYGALPT